MKKRGQAGSVLALCVLVPVMGCKGKPVPEVPVIAREKVVLDAGTDGNGHPKRLPYSQPRAPCAVYNPLRDPFFGDLHVHTERSLDAGIQDTRTTPAQAYDFARGQPLGIQPWLEDNSPSRTLQLGRPLDFAMVSDHAEFFGETTLCRDPLLDPASYASATCVDFRADPRANFVSWNLKYLGGILQPSGALTRFEFCGTNGVDCLNASTSVWQEIIQSAEAADDKTSECQFTAFVGYEYTGAPLSFNLHRNVVFRNADVPLQPLSYMEYSRPENLWQALDRYCNDNTNCQALTIPHNSNISGDLLFRREKTALEFSDFTAAYAATRQRYEPLLEIYQHKGDSECPRGADEYCSFEKLPFNNLIADRYLGFGSQAPGAPSFLRYALSEGLKQQEKLGVNPFKYGVVASTDTHLGTPGLVQEANYPGHGGAGADNGSELKAGLSDLISFGPGGLAVLWAEENSRDYLFDAMQRRETQATSGPRILMRMFGGWHYDKTALCQGFGFDPNGEALRRGRFPVMGDAGGVPMGSDLPAYPGSGAPTFAVGALKDPGYFPGQTQLQEPSRGLQRIQIIKGWVDTQGLQQQRVYTVAGGDNDASVDLNTCTGQEPDPHAALCTVWQDPDFDPGISAVYYARVLENPGCRWSWQQCLAYLESSPFDSMEAACTQSNAMPFGYRQCCLHQQVAAHYANQFQKQQLGTYPATVQERAWTSPIWYNAGAP